LAINNQQLDFSVDLWVHQVQPLSLINPSVGPLAALEPKLHPLEILHNLLHLGLLVVLELLTLVDHHYSAAGSHSSSSHREYRAVACLDKPLLCLELTLKTIQE